MGDADFATCRADSVQFAYPTNWVAEMEQGDEGVSVSLQSPGVSFAVVGAYSSDENPYDLIEQTLAALREEHPSIESEEILDEPTEVVQDLSEDAVNVEANFLSIDTVVHCWLRSWKIGANSVVVLMQSIDREATVAHAVFRAVCRSIRPIAKND